MTAVVEREGADSSPRRLPRAAPLQVALVNNMPDAALVATERQFLRLLTMSDPRRPVSCRGYYLPEVARGAAGLDYCRSHYLPVEDLWGQSVDLLVVTGCEPRAGSLTGEPFWKPFARLVDWARSNTRSALWSCLAAHAAVLHLDGIERHRLPGKLTGVFDCAVVGEHPLVAGLGSTIRVPHSRYYDLRAIDVRQAGYEVLTEGERTGVDMFIKTMPSLFVFMQGHPEYAGDSLGREFRRDVERYFAGIRARLPDLPDRYFSDTTARRLRGDLVRGPDPGKAGLDAFRAMFEAVSLPRADWAPTAMRLYSNWFQNVSPQNETMGNASRKGRSE